MTLAHLVDGRESLLTIFSDAVEPTGVVVRMDIHDASRLEWSVALPLPEEKAHIYTIAVEMDIPSNAFARHTPWDQLQSFTRLDGGVAFGLEGDVLTIDALRRGAVAVATQLARVGEQFSRDCVVAASLFTKVHNPHLERSLEEAIEKAVAIGGEARRRLVAPHDSDAPELGRERRLVDEYVSVRLLAMLAGAEQGLDTLEQSRASHVARLRGAVAAIESQIADAVEVELSYRERRGFVCADPLSQASLEDYLDRASRLKKHFQEVLFLEAEVFQVAERLHHWAALLGALIASTWAVAWQMALSKHAASPGGTVGSGLVTLVLVAGFIYATKDRVKDMGRAWISGNVHRFYAQRVARYRAPTRRVPTRDVVVAARESFEQRLVRRPDPLNPESGSQVPSTLIRYSHRGKVLPTPALAKAGVKRVKHVFRYDLSPLFGRLDDAVKQVPVLDRTSHRVRFSEAPRSYRFPIRIRVACGSNVTDETAIVVLHKGGLDRLERPPTDL
jgi:hypothetical protein